MPENNYGYQYEWPKDEGCSDTPKQHTFYPGNLIDRFGPPSGNYFGFVNDEYIKRSLPYFNSRSVEGKNIDYNNNNPESPANIAIKDRYYEKHGEGDAYHMYIVKKQFEVKECTIAPAYGFPGGGTQYFSKDNAETLIEKGYIIEHNYKYVPYFDERIRAGGKRMKPQKHRKTRKSKSMNTKKRTKTRRIRKSK